MEITTKEKEKQIKMYTMSNKVIYAIYNDDDVLMDAVKKTRAAHYHIEDVFTPFPVHGLDKAMGLAPTRLAICAFIYGLCGISFATWMMNYIMIQDWPQILEVSQVLVTLKICLHLFQLCLKRLFSLLLT